MPPAKSTSPWPSRSKGSTESMDGRHGRGTTSTGHGRPVHQLGGDGAEQDPHHRAVAARAGDQQVGADLLAGLGDRRGRHPGQRPAGGGEPLVDRLDGPGHDRARFGRDRRRVTGRAGDDGRRSRNREDDDRRPAGQRQRFGPGERRFRLRGVVVGDGDRAEGAVLLGRVAARRGDHLAGRAVQEPVGDAAEQDPPDRPPVRRADDDRLDLLALGEVVDHPGRASRRRRRGSRSPAPPAARAPPRTAAAPARLPLPRASRRGSAAGRREGR